MAQPDRVLVLDPQPPRAHSRLVHIDRRTRGEDRRLRHMVPRHRSALPLVLPPEVVARIQWNLRRAALGPYRAGRGRTGVEGDLVEREVPVRIWTQPLDLLDHASYRGTAAGGRREFSGVLRECGRERKLDVRIVVTVRFTVPLRRDPGIVRRVHV